MSKAEFDIFKAKKLGLYYFNNISDMNLIS